MLSLAIWFIVLLVAVWLLTMVILWKTHESRSEDYVSVVHPLIKKSMQVARRIWFTLLRAITAARIFSTRIITKLFFAIFPNARKAFEQKDELTGLEQGPSSYFLMSISEGKEEVVSQEKKSRRKRKNV